MLIISKEQFKVFDNYLLDKFLIRSKEQFQNVNDSKLKAVFKEAISFGIVDDLHMTEYARLYFNNEDVFVKKPNWMIYVLSNSNYEPADKLLRIGSELKNL